MPEDKKESKRINRNNKSVGKLAKKYKKHPGTKKLHDFVMDTDINLPGIKKLDSETRNVQKAASLLSEKKAASKKKVKKVKPLPAGFRKMGSVKKATGGKVHRRTKSGFTGKGTGASKRGY
jgi:phage terminase large subunit-like protein|tara:strand:+ start:3400 stop:3762 length:363 start_codon:yes stop_codon:yes gene_type:complete